MSPFLFLCYCAEELLPCLDLPLASGESALGLPQRLRRCNVHSWRAYLRPIKNLLSLTAKAL